MELAQRNEALQQAKEALEMSSAHLQVLLEQLPSGVMLVSAEDYSISIINRRAVEILQSVGVALEPTDDPDEAARHAIGRNADMLLNEATRRRLRDFGEIHRRSTRMNASRPRPIRLAGRDA